MERTKKIFEIFGMNKEDEEDFEKEEILNFEPLKYDNLRIFRFLNAYRRENTIIREQNNKTNKYETEEEMEFSTEQSNIELDECKIFMVKKELKNLFELTKPSSFGDVKLPFDHIFLDVDLTSDDQRAFGIKIGYEINAFTALADFLKWRIDKGEKMAITKENLNKLIPNGEHIISIRYGYFDGDMIWGDFFLYDYNKLKIVGLGFKNRDKREKFQKKIANFVSNILLFLNEPRVVTHVVDRPQKNREKRGKIPIPSEIKTRIHADLQNYIENIYFTGQSHSKLGYQFDVMGHWRIFKAERYVNKKGQKIWIPPHVRGEGLKPPQVFEITP